MLLRELLVFGIKARFVCTLLLCYLVETVFCIWTLPSEGAEHLAVLAAQLKNAVVEGHDLVRVVGVYDGPVLNLELVAEDVGVYQFAHIYTLFKQ